MYRKSSVYRQGANAVTPVGRAGTNSPNDYRNTTGSIRRHVFTKNTPDIGSTSPLVSLFHFGFTLARFRRSFGAGSDDPPTPTGSVGNNYQTADVFNGGRIQNFSASIKLENTNANPITLTAYAVVCSFFDAHDQATIDTGSPIAQNISGASAQGQVVWNTPTANMFGENVVNLSKFRQRVFQKLGDITIGGTGGQSTAVLTLTRLPAKCRRANSGMFYGIAFQNDASKNTYGDFSLGASLSVAFDEVPSDTRLRWLE